MKALRLVLGALVVLSGLFFSAQGAGIIPWPSNSFMVNNSAWIYYGAAIAIVGVLLLRRVR